LNVIIYFCIVFLSSVQLYSQEQIFEINQENYEYQRPGTFDFILNVPNSFSSFSSNIFKNGNTLKNLLIGLSTALFIVVDQPVYDQISKWGRKWEIGNRDNTKTLIKIGKFPIFRGPTDLGSALYFIGDGWAHLGIITSFLTTGLINNDNRALQTASQIAQGMLTVGTTTQILKHLTGRETPDRASQDGGIWRFFPNQINYHKEVPKYDAYPSGHVATAMMTLTVIANNYEEYTWIRPVGYSLIALLSFQMINNGVHWLSDYPLALGIGYLFGKLSVNNGRKKLFSEHNENEKLSLFFYPQIGLDNSLGLSVFINF
jgi:membrane-associated phospholipid phosphatase